MKAYCRSSFRQPASHALRCLYRSVSLSFRDHCRLHNATHSVSRQEQVLHPNPRRGGGGATQMRHCIQWPNINCACSQLEHVSGAEASSFRLKHRS